MLKFLLHPKSWKNGAGKYIGSNGPHNTDFVSWHEYNVGPIVVKKYSYK